MSIRSPIRFGSLLLFCAWFAPAVTAGDGLVSVQQAKLEAFDGLPDDHFGAAIAVSGDRLVVGAPDNDDQGVDAGAVYAFQRTAGVWSVVDQIIPTQIGTDDNFGRSVGIDGDTFVSGAPEAGIGGGVHVFRWSGVQWNQEAILVGSDTAAGDLFGFFVSIDGDRCVVGAVLNQGNGAAYVFDRVGTSWSETGKLVASDGASGDWFGRAVSVSGSTIACGAPLSDPDGFIDAGACYLFELQGPNWIEAEKLVAPIKRLGAVFGSAAAITGDVLVVGAEHDSAVGPDTGSCHIFERIGGPWSLDASFTMPDPLTGSEYADSVAIAESGFGTFVVVGASGDDEALPGAGSAYVYQKELSGWKQADVLIPSDPVANSLFGSAVSVDQNTVVVGAPLPFGSDGSAYVFVETPVSGAGQSITPVDFGGSYLGTIAAGGELDQWVFSVLAGSSLQIDITGKGNLRPTFALLDHDTGDPVPGVTVSGEGNKKVVASVLPVPETSRMRLEIGSVSNSTGDYVVTSKAKTPPPKSSASFSAPQSDDILSLSFDVVPGSKSRLKTSHIDQNQAPVFVALIGPQGPVLFDQKKKPKAKNPISVTNEIDLDVLGTYTGFVEVQSGGGKVKITVDADLPKPAGKVKEGVHPGLVKVGKSILKHNDEPDAALRDLRDLSAMAYDLVDDPLLGHRVTDLSVASSFKKSKDLTKAWRASASAGSAHSLRFLPTEGVYAPSDFSGLDIPECPSERSTVVYVVQGDRTLASSAVASAVHLHHWLRTEDPTLSADVELRAFHTAADVSGGSSETIAGCLAALAQIAPLCELANMPGTATFWDVLAEPYQIVCAKIASACEKQVDVSEAIIDWPAMIGATDSETNGVVQLALALQHDVRSGRRAVVVAHGQGNTYLRKALIALNPAQRSRIGVIAVASPIAYADTGSFGHYTALTLAHDAILQVPGALPSNLANQWTEFFDLPCTNAPELCALEDDYLSVAIHGFDLSYLGNATSRTAVLGGIQNAVAAIAPAPLLGQGVLQVTSEWTVDAIVALHVVEPTGEDVSFAQSSGDAGIMDVTHLDNAKVENYYVCQPNRLLPGSYQIYIDNFEETVFVNESVTVMIRAGTEVVALTVEPNGAKDPHNIPVAKIKVSSDGTVSVKEL